MWSSDFATLKVVLEAEPKKLAAPKEHVLAGIAG